MKLPRLSFFVAFLLGLEALFLAFVALYPFVDPLAGLDPGPQGIYRILAFLQQLVALLSAVLLFLGIKVLNGNNFFFNHAWHRRAVVVGVPAFQVLCAALARFWAYGNTPWGVIGFFGITAILSATVLRTCWQTGVEPRAKEDTKSSDLNLVRVLILMIVVIVPTLVLMAWLYDDDVPPTATPADIIRDDAQIQIVRAQIDEVIASMNSFPGYDSTKGTPAAYSDCYVDESGNLFQPGALRSWRVSPDASNVISERVGNDLRASGWKVDPPPVPGGYLNVEYTSKSGWHATGDIFTTFERDQVGLVARISNAQPCSLPKRFQ